MGNGVGAAVVTNKYDFDGDKVADTATFTIHFVDGDISSVELSVKTSDGKVYNGDEFPEAWNVNKLDDADGDVGYTFTADREVAGAYDGTKENVALKFTKEEGQIVAEHAVAFNKKSPIAQKLSGEYDALELDGLYKPQGTYRDGCEVKSKTVTFHIYQ